MISSFVRAHLCLQASSRASSRECRSSAVARRPPPFANTDTKLLIYGLFQKGRVLAQDGEGTRVAALCGILDSSGTRIDDTWDDDGGEGYNAPHLDQNVLAPATPR